MKEICDLFMYRRFHLTPPIYLLSCLLGAAVCTDQSKISNERRLLFSHCAIEGRWLEFVIKRRDTYSQIEYTILRNWRTTYARFISIGITSSHFLQAFCAIAFKSLQCRLINSYFIFLQFLSHFFLFFHVSYYNRINV